MRFVEALPSEQIQTALDVALRFALEMVTFEKIVRARGEQPPNFGTDIAAMLQEAIQTLNAAVKLGYRPSNSIYAEVEAHMQDDEWRVAWLEQQQIGRTRGREVVR